MSSSLGTYILTKYVRIRSTKYEVYAYVLLPRQAWGIEVGCAHLIRDEPNRSRHFQLFSSPSVRLSPAQHPISHPQIAAAPSRRPWHRRSWQTGANRPARPTWSDET